MRLLGLVALLFALGALAPAQAVSETAQGFAAAMQGCWNQTKWSPEIDALAAENGNTLSTRMCLDGGVEGALSVVGCHTHGELTECSTSDGRYAFRDEKFWRGFDDRWNNCDVLLEAGKRVTLKNCVRIDPPPALEPIEDAVFEKALDP